MHARIRTAVVAVAALGALASCSPPPTSDDARPAPRPGAGAGTAGAPAGSAEVTPAASAAAALAPMVPPSEHGPYGVGRSTFTVTDPSRHDRTLAVDIWYPAPGGAAGPLSAYPLPDGVRLEGRALDGPTPAPGPFPLVVFSHGATGLRFQSFSLAEALAGHGFVVAAPDHAGNTVTDQITGTATSFDETTVDRPLDVSLVVDHVLERSAAAGDVLAGTVAPDAVAVAGHSLGGFTALAVASGTDSVEADERVAAVVAMAPVSSLLRDEHLGAVDVPALVIGGTADTVTPIDPDVTRPFVLLRGAVRRVDVARASHWSFSDICRIKDTLRSARVEPEVERPFATTAVAACADDALPADDARRLTTNYVVAFLRVHLAGDDRYAPFLEPIDGVEVHVR